MSKHFKRTVSPRKTISTEKRVEDTFRGENFSRGNFRLWEGSDVGEVNTFHAMKISQTFLIDCFRFKSNHVLLIS